MGPITRARLISALLTLCASLLVTHAAAQPAQDAEARARADADAREFYRLGDELYASGQYEAAEQAFAAAYRLSRRPLLLFNLANAQERSGRWEAAVESLTAYREHAPEEEWEDLDSRIAGLQRRIGERAAQLRDEPVVVVQHDRVDMADPSSEERIERREPVAPHLIVLPAAGALLATTIGLGVATANARDDVRARCPLVAGQRWCGPDADGPLTRDRRLSISTDIFAVLTLGALGVGTWLLVRDLRAPDEDETTMIEVSGVRGGGMIRLRGSF